MLTFDEAQHRYFWNGERVPNVTAVLGCMTNYERIPLEVLERARAEGTHIHKAVELDCADRLDWDALPAWMVGHMKAWRRFKRETMFSLVASERKVYHPTYRYAGTLDLVGYMFFQPRGGHIANLLDIKRSFYAGAAIGFQTAAYREAYHAETPHGPHIQKRYGLQLRNDGTYRLEEFKEEDDFQVYLACLVVHRAVMKHGIGKTNFVSEEAAL